MKVRSFTKGEVRLGGSGALGPDAVHRRAGPVDEAVCKGDTGARHV